MDKKAGEEYQGRETEAQGYEAEKKSNVHKQEYENWEIGSRFVRGLKDEGEKIILERLGSRMRKVTEQKMQENIGE